MCGKGEIQSFNAAADPIRSWYGILYFDPDLSRSSSQLPKPQATNPTRLDISQLLSLKIWRCADFCVVQKQRSTDLESVGLWKGSIGLLVQIVFFSLGQEQQKGFGNPTGFLNNVNDFFYCFILRSIGFSRIFATFENYVLSEENPVGQPKRCFFLSDLFS